MIVCDEWSEAQVKAFRLLVNRSVTWADWDEELVALELEELKGMDFALDLTGFDPVEIDSFLLDESNEPSMPCQPFPIRQSRGAATCGDAAIIACCVEMRPMPLAWPACWASANRD